MQNLLSTLTAPHPCLTRKEDFQPPLLTLYRLRSDGGLIPAHARDTVRQWALRNGPDLLFNVGNRWADWPIKELHTGLAYASLSSLLDIFGVRRWHRTNNP